MTINWRKSTRSGSATDEACVEVACLPTGVGVRDSKDPDGERLTIPGDRFGELLRLIKGGVFDRP
ncbi:DUF397 domain-containing protein [Spirillospora albida]|uniref:DUF397 domain-containing protein n=1 Tax=Spirillospora albida TaxID=58123 RepID=UPI0004C132C7|nr:DUF397 domain-containing protein [Spirillospora albida]